MIPSSFTMSTLFATIAVVMMSFMFSVHIARAQSTSTDGTTVASSNDSSESTGTGNTTVASSDNSSASTGTGNTTVASANNSSASTGTGNTTVASSDNSSESTGTDNTNVASSYNSLESTGTDNTNVASTNNSLESTGTGNTTVASSDNSSASTGTGNTTVASANNSSESTGTDNTNVASSYNSLESTGTDNTNLASSNNSLKSTGTDNTNVASSNNSLESTGTDNTNVASSNNSLESTGTDNTNVASSNNSLERVGSHDTTVAYSNSISESTATDGTTLYSASEITSTDYMTVASSGNSPESTGSDSTTLYNASEITSTDDTTVESTDSTGSFHTTTEIPETTGTVTPTDTTGHTDSTTKTTEIAFGQNCSSGGGNCMSNLVCDNTSTCACQSGYYYNNSTNNCSQNIPFEQNCTSGVDKCVSNLICNTTNKCGCQSDYYYKSSTNSCSQNIPFEQNCTSGVDKCVSNLICNTTNKCGCQSDYYYKNSTNSCSQNIPFEQNCTSGVDKCVSNLICNTTNKCGCQSDYYYKSSTNSCSQNIPVGQNCSPGIDKCVSNLICDNTNKCGCQSDYYYKNSTNSCSQKLGHGEICQTPQTSLECKPANTVCTSDSTLSTNRCLCDSGFYRTDNSSCMSRSNLNITARVTRETRTVIFEWSDMSQRSDVNYSIKWNVLNTKNASSDGVTVTGLEPGTSYSFTVVTSLPGDVNYKPIIFDQPQTALWTRPDRPGPVNKTELVAKPTSTYAITFGQSNGSVSYYTMSVSTVESPIETKSNNSTSTVMYFTQLKAATPYSYTLESYNGNFDKSDQTTGQFTTDSEESGPVGGFNYMEVQSHTASVKWQTPAQSNGNITGYLVFLQNTSGCVYYIEIPCHGCDQVAPNINEKSVPSCTIKMDANVTGSVNDYNLQLPNLTPYRNYTVTVRAVNVKGLGEPATLTFQTNTSAPNDILALTVYSVRDDSTQKINLNIAWTPGDQTGPTDYYILVQETARQDTTEHNQSISSLIVTGYSNTTYVKYDVLAYWNYTVCVCAQTDKGNSSQKCAQNRTVENYPGAVQNLNITQDATVANIVTLTFECPEIMSRNGSIEQFEITQTHLDPQGQEIRDIYNQSASDEQSEPCSGGYKVTAKNIVVERNYSFTVMTVNNKYEGGVNNVSNFYIQPKVPHLVNPQEMFMVDTLVKQNGSVIELNKINADICSTCLTDVRWGTVINVGILVCVKGANCAVPGRKKRSTALQFTQIQSWGNAKLQDFKIEYRTTPNKWVPPVNGNNTYNPFVVGDNTTCSHANATDYCNGPLPAGQEFYISVIMCTTAGCSTYRERHVFATYVRENDDPHVGAIVGGVLGGLALIAVIGVIIFLVWHIRMRNEKQPRPHVVTTNEGKELIKKRPVRMRDFNDHVAKFHRDSKLLFQDEFESIRTVSDTFKNTCDEAKREQNRVKNRYADILPYDHSRVKLEILADDDETNNFINANYIPGYNSVREYIATQGPMYSTMPDFWKMIWEHKCKMIVMLSDLMESGKRKVDLYWPENLNEPITYGTVVVEMTNFSQLNKYIIRNFKLIKGEETRKVTHFFLPGWPDYGADIDFEVLLGFVKAVRREITPANQGPIVVHCSAGVGRSGTFIALDYFTQFVEKHSLDESIDVFDFVLQMRKNRTRMVQVETQYICIYDSINRLIQSKIKSEEEKLYENVSPGNGVYENFKPQEENIYANTTVKDDKYVYNNEAFEPDFGHSQKSDKPTTEL